MPRPRKPRQTSPELRAAICAMLDRLQEAAISAGIAIERTRVVAILTHPDAAGRSALAAELAISGLDQGAALEALSIAKISTAHLPPDGGLSRTH